MWYTHLRTADPNGAGSAQLKKIRTLLEGKTPEGAERKVREMLARKEKVPGFGHRVYRTFDPRAHFLRKMSKIDFFFIGITN